MNMRSASHNPYSDTPSSFHYRLHKDSPQYNIILNQVSSPKVVSQVIYEPIQFIKKPLQSQIHLMTEKPTQNTRQLNQRIKKFQEQQLNLKSKISVLTEQNKYLQLQIQKYKRTNVSSSDQLSLVQKINSLEKQKQQLIKCNLQLKKQLKIFLSKLDGINVDELSKQNENMNKQIAFMKSDHSKNIQSLQQQIQQLIIQLQGRNTRQRDLQLSIDNMRVQNRMLNKYLKVKDGQIIENNQIRRSCEDRIKKLQKVVEQLAKVKQGIDVINRVKDQYKQLNTCLSATREIVSQKQQQIKFLREQSQSYRQSIRSIISQKNDLKQTIKQLTRVIEIQKERNYMRQTKNNTKNKFKQEFENKIKDLVHQLNKLKLKINEDAKLYEQQIRNISQRKQESQIQIASLSTSLTIKSKEMNDKYQVISDLEEELKEVKTNNILLINQLGKLKVQHQRLSIQLKIKINQQEQAYRKLKYENEQSIKYKIKPLQEKVKCLQLQLQKQKSETLIKSYSNTQYYNSNISRQFDQKQTHLISSKSHQCVHDRLKLNQLKSQFYKQKSGNLQRQIQHTIHANKQLKQIVNKLNDQIDYLRQQLKNSAQIRSHLIDIQQKNENSIDQINSLKNDITKTNKISYHRQSSLTSTISQLREHLELKDIKIKELNNKVFDNNSQIQSLNKQLQISLNQSSILSQQRFQQETKAQTLQKQLNQSNRQMEGCKRYSSRIEQYNKQLGQSVSKLQIDIHLKVIQLTQSKQELQLLRCVNKGLNDKVELLSNQLIASSSNRMRQIMEMHSNVQTMVASLDMFHSKDSSFD